MNKFVDLASDFHGQLPILVFLSALMGLGKGGVPGFATISTALVVATALENVEGGLSLQVSLMVPILTMIDVYAAWLHRKSLDWPTVWILLPLSFVGMFIGQILEKYLTDRSARLLVGSILISILLLRMRTNILSVLNRLLPNTVIKKFRIRNESLPFVSSSKKKTSSKTGWICMVGLCGGAATMLTNSMGPILNLYLLSVLKLSPTSYIGTRAMFFCFLNLGKLPMRFAAGTLGWTMMPLALGLGMVAVLGVYCAKPIMLSLSEDVFVRLELCVVSLAGLKLLML